MSVHKPKLKNVPQQRQDAFVQHHLPYELWMMRECLAAAKRGATTRFQQNLQSVDRTFIRQRLVDMINEQISHVTSDRTEQQDEKFDEPEWLETANAIENEFQRWIANLKPEWAQKWEQRERMGEAARRELKIDSHFGGACTSPTMITGPTGPAPPPDAKK